MKSYILSARYADAYTHKPNHFHDCHQLLYVSQGSVRVTINNSTYTANSGTLILVSRFENHAIELLSKEYCRYTLEISPDINPQNHPGYDFLFSLLVNRPKNFRHAIDLSESPQAEHLILQILQENEATRSLKPQMLNNLLIQLLMLVYRSIPAVYSEQEKHLQLVQQIQQLFENNFQHPYTLAEISEANHISQSHLSHIFKRITGNSPIGYLTHCRLAAAKKYLAETEMDINEIVAVCGFCDSSYFSYLFRSYFGLTPSAFRKQNQQNSH